MFGFEQSAGSFSDEPSRDMAIVEPRGGDGMRSVVAQAGSMEIRDWLVHNRRDGFSALLRTADPDDARKQTILKRMRGKAGPAMTKRQRFVAELGH